MQKNTYPGIFIIFEGLDGSGQSTQAKLLRDFLIKKRYKAVLTKEPTLDSEAGKKIREILTEKTVIESARLQELFVEDRKEHLKNLIIPALKNGKIVISDRYFFSTFAFGAADGLDLKWLIKINDDFLLPDLTFILKVSPKICIQRIEKRGKGIKFFEKKEKLAKVWQFYQTFPKKFENVMVINGEKPIEEVFKDIKKMVNYRPLAKIIDHTNIKQRAVAEDIIKTCQEAREFGFRGVCVNPEWVKIAKSELRDRDIKVVVLIDPPMGLSSHSQRVKLCQRAKKDGADELDIVINIIDLKYEKYDKIIKDLKKICKILPTKVIIGSGYLTNEEIKKASEIVKKAGAFCVKTATFKDPLDDFELEEKAKHLKIMRKSAPGLLIKASGAINNLKDAKLMLKAGADIIGTSSGVEIAKGIQAQKEEGEY